MSKRLTDTEIWSKEWFLRLTLKEKLLVKFLFDNCDCAGIYEPNYMLLSFYFSEEITKEDFNNIKQVKILDNGNFFIEDFISFQYGVSITELNPKFSVHKGVLKQLQKNSIITVTKGLDNSCNITVLNKDKDKDKDIDKDIDIEIKENLKKEDIYCNQDFEKCFKIYSETCKKLNPLRFERRSRVILEQLSTFLDEIEYDFDYFQELCIKANELEKIMDTKIDFKMMLNNHIGITSGKYKKVKTANDYEY